MNVTIRAVVRTGIDRGWEEENTPTSLPILTIGSVNRLDERGYREECAERLVEIVLDLENYLGASRIFIP